jgi:lipoprotein-releasing system permease protein
MTGSPTPVYWTMRVTGLFETGMFIYDNEFVVMDRETAQAFAGLGDAVSTISVMVEDPWHAPAVQARLEASLSPTVRVETWQEQNAALFGALKLEKLGMGLVIFFIMIVAAFNIVGTFTMLVAFKTREIGILQAMGLPARSVGRIFLTQGAIIGLLGTSLGLILGLATALIVDQTGLVRIDPSIYFLDHLPIHIDPFDVLVVVLASMALAVVATIHPARRAAALTPVEAVRAE